MKNPLVWLLWLLTALLAFIPLLMYLAYRFVRLDSRRQQLLQSIFTLGLDDVYMWNKHRRYYAAWKGFSTDEDRKTKFESDYFNKDFKSLNSFEDFSLPVVLTTVLGGAGWYFVLSHVYPKAGISDLTQFPETLAWGFVGAFFASLLAIIEGFREYSLTPGMYYSLAYRLLFSSTAAFLAGQTFKDSFSSLVAFGVGLLPIEKTWAFISEKTAQVVGTGKKEEEKGANLAAIQGLEDTKSRQSLVVIGITTVQALATADPLVLLSRTTFPIRTVLDMIDKAILYLYIGDKVKELRAHGINGMIELVALANLSEKRSAYAGGLAPGAGKGFSTFFEQVNAAQLIQDVAKVLGQSEDELKAFIYNMYYDPVLIFIYEVWGRYGLPPEGFASPLVSPKGEPVKNSIPLVS